MNAFMIDFQLTAALMNCVGIDDNGVCWNAGGTPVATTYGYLAGGHGTGSTTPLVQTITQSGTTLTYAYDDCGNITSVSDGVKTISYAYDLLGQLIRANDPYDATAGSNGTTWVYAYDLGGNILSKTAYAYTTGTVGTAVKTDSFTYGDANWKDKLTAYNGAAISYDAIGNPLSDGTWTYTWAKGRQLQNMSKSGETVSFVYNENGLRVQKVATSTGTTKYTLHGKNIVHLTNGSNSLHFFYDAQNKPAVVLFNGTAYAYLYNLQDDVIALVDANGSKVVEYKYDAWGKPISKTGTLASTLGTVQPFRYRGYVYDEETGLYYLRSRYYNTSMCRFCNSDTYIGIAQINAHNMYAYCRNNPINQIDSLGKTGIDSKADAYMTQYYIMSLHDYRSVIINGMVALGHDYTSVSSMSDMQLYDCLVNEVAKTMTYNVDKGSMRIPNDTDQMRLLQEMVVYSHDYYAEKKYYARDVADACLARYTKETGKTYGTAADKIALEIRLHYNIYTLLLMMGINEEHTRVTDIIPTEGNIFQKGIDALYWLGVK